MPKSELMVYLKFKPEIEILAAGDVPRRRHWSDADKLQVVKKSYLGHRQVTATARRHGISRSLLTTWRRQYRNGELSLEIAPAFVPLTLAPEVSDAQHDRGLRRTLTNYLTKPVKSADHGGVLEAHKITKRQSWTLTP